MNLEAMLIMIIMIPANILLSFIAVILSLTYKYHDVKKDKFGFFVGFTDFTIFVFFYLYYPYILYMTYFLYKMYSFESHMRQIERMVS